MRRCEALERYLDRRLPDREAIEFEAHLAGCGECAASVERWRTAARDLAADPFPESTIPPTPAEAARLAAIAAARRTRPGRYRIAAAAAIILVGAAATIALLRTGPAPRVPVGVPAISATLSLESVTREVDPEELLRYGLTVPVSGRASVRLGDDAVELASGSRFALVQVSAAATRVRLDAGAVTCTVARRGPGREFVVEAGAYRVRVTGTRFTVAIPGGGGLDVRVRTGTVEVSRSGALIRRLAAGERLAIPEREVRTAAATAEAEPGTGTGPQGAAIRRAGRGAAAPDAEPPTIETLRGWIVGGQYGDAEIELRARVAQAPADAEARSLLADCLRKQARWEEAADAYLAVVGAADPTLAARARFVAGEILSENLGRHAEAITLFSGYLDAAGPAAPLRAEALVRLARSLLALGRVAEARARLEEAVAKHPGTTIALEAKRLLADLDRKGEGNGRLAP
jgi:tetratricopeptide (TPR) repeat protein